MDENYNLVKEQPPPYQELENNSNEHNCVCCKVKCTSNLIITLINNISLCCKNFINYDDKHIPDY